jgi:hypothetical protein
MLKYRHGSKLLGPFVEAGIGAYKPKSGSTEPGANAGLGLRFDSPQDWAVELAVDYHRIFTSGDDVEYLAPQIRWIFGF